MDTIITPLSLDREINGKFYLKTVSQMRFLFHFGFCGVKLITRSGVDLLAPLILKIPIVKLLRKMDEIPL